LSDLEISALQNEISRLETNLQETEEELNTISITMENTFSYFTLLLNQRSEGLIKAKDVVRLFEDYLIENGHIDEEDLDEEEPSTTDRLKELDSATQTNKSACYTKTSDPSTDPRMIWDEDSKEPGFGGDA
jgi:hypothetical protein